jgi:chromosome segregation and condensation protein ScpB
MSLSSKIESLLFISGRPMSTRELAELTKEDSKKIEAAGDELVKKLAERNEGVRVIKNRKIPR